MNRFLSFASVFVLLLIVSCQKEKSYEQGRPSKGSLQDSSGNCLSKTVAGTYKATKSLADSNFIEVEVNVSQPGSYTIYTDTVNGYYFRATGNFNKTGANTVRLKGSGTPAIAGTDDFYIFYDSTFCDVSVTVMPNAASSGGTAVYSLKDNTGNCLGSTPSGTYTQGVVLTSSNKVDIQVNVTTVGTWNITTASVGGFAFSGSGTFTATGLQTITLTGSGTPTASGVQTFAVTVGSATCNFNITVAAGTAPPPNTGDYFPRTVGSHWTYMFDGDPNDTLRVNVIPQTKSVSGNIYNIFMADDGLSVDTLGYYRKSGSDYFQWGDIGDEFGFDNPLYAEVIMLKDNQAANYSWTSSSFAGTISGQAATLRKKYTITQKNATITSNGVQYPNTIAVKVEYQISAAGTWVSDPSYLVFFYTKNYGMTKFESHDATGAVDELLELVNYKVF